MNRQIFYWLIIIAIFLITSCTLSPRYTQPKAPIPENWPKGEAYPETKTTPEVPKAPELKWSEFFTDEKLQKLIVNALDNNRDLRLAALNVERARALYKVQRAELFPTINASGNANKQKTSRDFIHPGEPRITERYEVNLGITSWEVDFFGRLRSLKKKALEEYLSTEEARRSTQILLISEIATTYLTLAADRESLEIARSTLETQQSVYNLIQKQYQSGIATKLDLRRAQTQVDAARQELARYTQLVAQDQNALNLLAGSPVSEELLPINLSSVKPPREISPGLPSEVLLLRPDIMAAEHQLKAAYAYIGAARAAFFPRISLTSLLGTASDELSGLFSHGTGTWSFSRQIVTPIFDTRTWAAYRVSQAEREIALAQYEKAIQTAFREVADALSIKGTIDQQIVAQESLVEANSETYKLAKSRYTTGIDSYLSVLDAQRSLYSAQQALVTLRQIKLANQVRLYAVLGGGSE